MTLPKTALDPDCMFLLKTHALFNLHRQAPLIPYLSYNLSVSQPLSLPSKSVPNSSPVIAPASPSSLVLLDVDALAL